MTKTELAALIRFKTKTNSTTFTDSDMLPLVNMFINDISSRIVERDAGYFLVPTTFDLVANQREYGLPDDLLNRLHKLELKFSASDSRFPSRNIKDYMGSETESEIVAQFGNSEGQFAHTIRRRALFILSGTISNCTAGGRIWYNAFPAPLTTSMVGATDIGIDPSTTTFGFPKQFHELLARYVSIEFKGAQPKPILLNDKEKNIEYDMERQLAAIAHIDDSAEIIGENMPSQDLGADGWNY